MAKQSEEQRDTGLFNMSLGDGMINTEEVVKPPEAGGEEPEKKNDVPDLSGDVPIYQDGSFEITSEPEQAASPEDQQEFIEKTDKEEIKKTPSKAPSESSSSSPFLAFAQDRAAEGVFLEFNDEDWNALKERNEGDEAAALRELSQISVREMVRQGVENFKQSISDDERVMYEAREKGLPVDEYSVAKRNEQRYSSIKEEQLTDNEDLQKELVKQILGMRGFSKEEVEEEIEGYKALDNLESKAKKALEVLPGVFKKQVENIEQNAQIQEQARQDSIRQRIAKMKRDVDNTPEIIPGIKLTKPTREKIINSMTVPVAKDSEGNPLNPVMATRSKNPDAFEMMVHYYHSLGLFNIDESGQAKPDFSKIMKVQKTKATDELRSILESTERTVAGKTVSPKVSDDELDEFEKAFRRL